jgi:hypothetical protein
MGIACSVEIFRSEGVQTGGSKRVTILIAYYLIFDNVKQRYYLEGLAVGGRIILKWISNK